jgi:adenylate cyclase
MIKKNIKSKSLKFDLLMRIVISVSLSFLVIVSYNDYASQKLVLEIAKTSTKKQEEAAFDVVNAVVAAGKKIEKEIAFLYTTLDFSNKLIQTKMLELVKVTETVDVITLKLNKDESTFIRAFQIRKLSELKTYMGVLIPKKSSFILNISEKSKNKILFFDENLNFISENLGDTPTENDIKSNENWPNIYIKNNLPMISYKNIINKADGNAQIEVEINVKELALDLGNIRITDRARIFILDGKDRVIVDSDDIEGMKTKLVKINDFGNMQLQTALEKCKGRSRFDKISYFTVGGDSFLSAVTVMPPSSTLDWKVVTIISTKDFLEEFRYIEKISFILSIITLLLVLTFLYFQIQKLSEPITYLSMEANKINNLELDDPVHVVSKMREIRDLNAAMQQLKVSVNNFSKYIPKGLVKRFVDSGEPVEIGGKSTNITIFFSDVANFTTISEQTPPQELIFQLSDYFESLSSIILENEGTIDKFIGDAVMAFWGAPDIDENQIIHACRSALICQHKLNGLNRYWAATNKPILVTRIGIHSGTAVVGNIGSTERMNYTALGDSVNLAARLEGINKMYGTRIMISEAVRKGLPSTFVTRPIDIVAVKGKDVGVPIFELMGVDNDPYLQPIPAEVKEFAKQFGEAFDLYIKQKWEEAISIFLELRKANLYPDDIMAEKYIERCQKFIVDPPGQEWDGVVHLKEK